jgi:hypothetical protein
MPPGNPPPPIMPPGNPPPPIMPVIISALTTCQFRKKIQVTSHVMMMVMMFVAMRPEHDVVC